MNLHMHPTLNADAGGSREELQQQWIASTQALSAALCTAAEVYLTDACDEAEAESKCEALATEALQVRSRSITAHQRHSWPHMKVHHGSSEA